MTDNLYAVRRLRDKLKKAREPDFEVREGDLIHSIGGGQAWVVIDVTSRAETMQSVVRYYIPGKGESTITLKRLERQVDRGLFKIYKGSKWSEGEGD